MDMMEKVEKLRAKANVSYEEAKSALEEANGDLLDAMILLEKQGKVEAPKSESYSTKYEDNVQYPMVIDQVESNESEKSNGKSNGSSGSKIKDWIAKAWQKGNDNYLIITRNGDIKIDIPVWVFILILILAWHVSLIVILISLFFGCRYQFIGADDLNVVNKAASKVSDAAEKIKEEFNKKDGTNKEEENI